MAKYRIVEKTERDGSVRFLVQMRHLFSWLYLGTDFRLEDAKARIDRYLHPEKYERVVYEAGE